MSPCPRARCRAARRVRRAATGNGATVRASGAPHRRKARLTEMPWPTATAPVVDSTLMDPSASIAPSASWSARTTSLSSRALRTRSASVARSLPGSPAEARSLNVEGSLPDPSRSITARKESRNEPDPRERESAGLPKNPESASACLRRNARTRSKSSSSRTDPWSETASVVIRRRTTAGWFNLSKLTRS